MDGGTVSQTGVRESLHTAMAEFGRDFEEVHLHLDLDVLNPGEAPANGFVTENVGLSVNELSEAIAFIRENLKITSATIASFDPRYDAEGKTLSATLKVIKQMINSERIS